MKTEYELQIAGLLYADICESPEAAAENTPIKHAVRETVLSTLAWVLDLPRAEGGTRHLQNMLDKVLDAAKLARRRAAERN